MKDIDRPGPITQDSEYSSSKRQAFDEQRTEAWVTDAYKRAIKTDYRYDLTERLGLTSETDIELAQRYLAQRLLRMRIYSHNIVLNHPASGIIQQ